MAVNQLLRKMLTTSMPLPQDAYIAPMFGQAKRIAWSYCREFAGVIPDAKFYETELRRVAGERENLAAWSREP